MVNSKSSETASRCGRPSRTSRSQSPGEGHVSLCPCCSAQSSTTINGQGPRAPASHLFPWQQTADGMYVCFRPGCCAGEGLAATYKSSTTFPDETLTFIKTFPLMDESVPSVNDRPYFTRTTSRYGPDISEELSEKSAIIDYLCTLLPSDGLFNTDTDTASSLNKTHQIYSRIDLQSHQKSGLAAQRAPPGQLLCVGMRD